MNPDIKLDETTEKLLFVDGDLQLTSGASDILRQKLSITLKTFKGEYFMDTEAGVPYYQSIFLKNIPQAFIDNTFKQVIRRVDGVETITDFTSILNPLNRTYTLTFSIITSEGDTLTITI